MDFPPFANSSMDGYAVISADLSDASPNFPVRLEVIEDVPAGYSPIIHLESGKASRIMTGAMLPQGADGVIPLEFTTESQDGREIACHTPITPGDYIRPLGHDFHKNDILIPFATRLDPRHIALLSSLGFVTIPVFRKPRVAILTSGSELIPPGSQLEPGKVIDTNSILLSSMVEEANGDPIKLGIAKDDPDDIRRLLNIAVDLRPDLIITSAGVSVGKYDYIKEIISEKGEIAFWKVNLRPGKPFAFGTYNGIPFLGMPGNPVSTFVTFLLFAKPLIQKLSGISQPIQQIFTAQSLEQINSDGRESYLRATATSSASGKILVKLTESHQGSGNIFGLTTSNALLIVPNGVKSLPIGAKVKIILIGDLISK